MNVGILVQQNLCERVRRGLCKRHWLSRITKPKWDDQVFLDLMRGKVEIKKTDVYASEVTVKDVHVPIRVTVGAAHGENLKDGERRDQENQEDQDGNAQKPEKTRSQKSTQNFNLLLLELNRTGRAAVLRSIAEKDSDDNGSVRVVQTVEKLIEVDLGSSCVLSDAKVAKGICGEKDRGAKGVEEEPAIVCRLVEFGGKHQHQHHQTNASTNTKYTPVPGPDGDAIDHNVNNKDNATPSNASGTGSQAQSVENQPQISLKFLNAPTNNPPLSKSNFTFIDLFAGIGGFACGLGSGKFHDLQGDCLVASEIDSEARLLYEKNHGMPRWGFNVDMYNLDVDGLMGRELREFNGCKSELRVFDHDLETRFVPRQTDYGPSQLTETKTTDASHSTSVTNSNVSDNADYYKDSESRSDRQSHRQSDSKSQQKRIGEIDVLCAGFPCQSFTKANSDARGLDCEKNGPFFFEILRLLGGKRNPEIIDRVSGSRSGGGATLASGSGEIGSSAGSSNASDATGRSCESQPNNLNNVSNFPRPKALILENVPNLIDLDDGETFQIIQEHLEECNYKVFHKIISTQEAGLPQNRERLYIVAFLQSSSYGGESGSSNSNDGGNASGFNFTWPDFKQNSVQPNSLKGGAKEPVRSKERSLIVRDILEPDSSALWNGPHRLTAHQWEKVRNHRSYKTSLKRRLVDVDDVSRTLGSSYRRGFLIQSEFVPVPVPEKGMQKATMQTATDVDLKAILNEPESDLEVASAKRRKLSDSAGGAAEEEAKENVDGNGNDIRDNVNEIDDNDIINNVIISNNSNAIPSPPRFFTPRECARLQGFPEDFVIEGKRNPNRWYHQCGNSVSPVVVSAIAEKVVEVLMSKAESAGERMGCNE